MVLISPEMGADVHLPYSCSALTSAPSLGLIPPKTNSMRHRVTGVRSGLLINILPSTIAVGRWAEDGGEINPLNGIGLIPLVGTFRTWRAGTGAMCSPRNFPQ